MFRIEDGILMINDVAIPQGGVKLLDFRLTIPGFGSFVGLSRIYDDLMEKQTAYSLQQKVIYDYGYETPMERASIRCLKKYQLAAMVCDAETSRYLNKMEESAKNG